MSHAISRATVSASAAPSATTVSPSSASSQNDDVVRVGAGITAAQISGLSSGATTLTPIYNVATGAVTTVEWSATPRINYIEIATPTTITNSLTTIGNCASNAEIEVWLNCGLLRRFAA